jgi:phage gpG-like protein
MSTEIIVQDAEVRALFKQVQAVLGNMQPVMADFGKYMEGSIDRNFAAEGRPERWAPLKWGTITSWIRSRKSWRTKTGNISKAGFNAIYNRKILHDRGHLQRSITSKAFAGRVEIFPTFPAAKYGIFHQLGTKKMAARKYLLMQRENWDYLLGKLSAALEGTGK